MSSFEKMILKNPPKQKFHFVIREALGNNCRYESKRARRDFNVSVAV